MKYISSLAIACGVILLLPALLLSAVAISDAAARCPGLQCSDALGSAAIGAVAAGIGLVLIAGGAFRLWRRRS